MVSVSHCSFRVNHFIYQFHAYISQPSVLQPHKKFYKTDLGDDNEDVDVLPICQLLSISTWSWWQPLAIVIQIKKAENLMRFKRQPYTGISKNKPSTDGCSTMVMQVGWVGIFGIRYRYLTLKMSEPKEN